MPDEEKVWQRPWEWRAPAFEIVDGVYFVGNTDVSCHLVKGTEKLLLIDTAFAQTTYLLTESIRSVGFDPAEIDIIAHSHGHVDHCGGTRRMAELTGAKLVLGEPDVECVEQGTRLTCAESWYGMERFETFKVDRALKHGDTIDLGGIVVTAHHTPGHTAGTMTYTFEVEVDGGRNMLAGMFGGPGLWTMTGEYIETDGYPGNREDFARSLDYLKTLDVQLWLGAHPGQNDTLGKYGRLKSGELPNPFIDPDGWHAFLDGLSAEFHAMCGG
jgi:metallo-beta-lactamase class B